MVSPLHDTSTFDLAAYAACVFDLDGTVWLGRDPIPGAVAFLDRCRAAGTPIAYATNAIVYTPDELSLLLVEAGIARPDEPVITSGTVISRVVSTSGVRELVGEIPAPLHEQLDALGITVHRANEVDTDEWRDVRPDRALVMAASRTATFGAVEVLGRLASWGHPLYLSSNEPGFPSGGRMEPGGGLLFQAARGMYDIEATVLGKPSQHYADTVRAALETSTGAPISGTFAFFGDSQRADIGTAQYLGGHGVLLTDHSVAAPRDDLPTPHFMVASLADLPT